MVPFCAMLLFTSRAAPSHIENLSQNNAGRSTQIDRPGEIPSIELTSTSISTATEIPKFNELPCETCTTAELNKWMLEQQKAAAVEDLLETKALRKDMMAMQQAKKEYQDAIIRAQIALAAENAAKKSKEAVDAAAARSKMMRAKADAENLRRLSKQKTSAVEILEATLDLNRKKRALQKVENKFSVAHQLWANAQQRYHQLKAHPDPAFVAPLLLALKGEIGIQEAIMNRLKTELPVAEARISPAQRRLNHLEAESNTPDDFEDDIYPSPQASADIDSESTPEPASGILDATPIPVLEANYVADPLEFHP